MKLYVDGKEVASASAAPLAGIDLNANSSLLVNLYGGATVTYDEAMVWQKALTADDVELLYQSER